MIFEPTRLPGSLHIVPERHEDERGFFARSWCRHEFEAHGLNPTIAQCDISFNRRAGTLRGLHYQLPPRAEVKLVRCTMGSIFDVILDLRKESPTYGEYVGAFLNAENREMLLVPEGCAHGFLTLEDRTEVFYQMSEFFSPEHARGVRWNDPAFGIRWPGDVRVISDRDAAYPDYER